MKLTREKIQRMVGNVGGGSGGGGGISADAIAAYLAPYAQRSWVDENYLSIAFFARLFTIHGKDANDADVVVNPNDLETTITNIQAMFGFWTNLYLSALGNGGTSSSGIRLSQLDDVNVSGVQNDQVLTWNAATSKWVPGTPSAGIDMSAVWNALAGVDATKKIDNSHLKLDTFFTDFSNISTGDDANKTQITIGGTTMKLLIAYASYAANAGTLGGTAKGDLFSALANSGNNISITIGGTTRNLLVGYASEAGRLSDSNSYDLWGLTYWSSGTPNSVSGCADMQNGLKVGNICIECSSSKVHTGYNNEINNFSHSLALQYSNNNGVQIGSSSYSSNELAVYGGIYSTGYVTALSDIRFKDVIRHFALDAETIANASIIQYRRKDIDDKTIRVGGIAQEWQKILPETVHEAKDGKLSMDYSVIAYTSVVSLAKKVVEQQQEIDDLKRKNEILEKQLERIEAYINSQPTVLG